MEKDKSTKGNNKGEKQEAVHKGGPNSSNRQTGESNRHEKDNSSGRIDEKNTTKKGSNAV